MNLKLNFPYTIGICLFIMIPFAIYAYNKSKNVSTTSAKLNPKENEEVKEYYPYYPYLYKDKTSLIIPNSLNYRALGDGNLLVWNDTPINPLLIECRKDDYQKELCKTIIGNQSSIPTTP